jgi:8-amino-7-oxononanoate synthase
VKDFVPWLEERLAELQAAGRLRACPEVEGASRLRPGTAAQPLVSFCSNDYLGLVDHPDLAAAATAAARTGGFGAGASRLVAGDLPELRTLERDLAAFTGHPAALVFPSGYQTNIGVITALAGPEDLIVSDAANHASLIDGCRLSRASVRVYPHRDAPAARAALASSPGARLRLLVTESLFSMDGDVAPLAALAEAAAATDAILVVDEAHALGVMGPGGRGLCADAGVRPDVLIGTLGKAFGASGGFAAGPAALRSFLVNRARTFIYTTGLPPPVAAAAAAALALALGTDGERRRSRLEANCRQMSERLVALGLMAAPPPGPILPVVLGPDGRAVAVAAALRARGFFVPAIRPPTVPEGTARLRVTISSEHRTAEIDAFAGALAAVLAEVGG